MNNIIARKLDDVYRDYRAETITAETAVRSIIELLDALECTSEKEYNRKYIAELIKKGVRYIIRIDAISKQTYDFLENCVIDSSLDLNARYEIFSILERRFPKKVKGVREYLLTHASEYFPDNIIYNDGFQGTHIIDSGLAEFLFKNYKIMSTYGDFSFYDTQQCFSFEGCIIVNVKRDMFKSKNYTATFHYAQRDAWKIEGRGSSYYLIEDKYRVDLKDLMFSVNIFRNHIRIFDEYKLSIQFSNDISSVPHIRISYEDCEIRIYFLY